MIPRRTYKSNGVPLKRNTPITHICGNTEPLNLLTVVFQVLTPSDIEVIGKPPTDQIKTDTKLLKFIRRSLSSDKSEIRIDKLLSWGFQHGTFSLLFVSVVKTRLPISLGSPL